MSANVNVERREKAPVGTAQKEDLGHQTILPAIDVCETDSGWLLVADMPGVSKDDVDVQVERGVLTLSGRSGIETPSGRPVYEGFQQMDYFRSVTLSDEIDRGAITANIANGVLTVVLPRAASAQTRKITVQSGE
jgi:HSP20 family protein